ncbi:MAG: V-type ATPase subunit [Promethearchaeota archaeon]
MELQSSIGTSAYIIIKVAAAKNKLINKNQFLELASSENIEQYKEKLVEIEKDISSTVVESSKDLEKTLYQIFFNYASTLIKYSPKDCQYVLINYIQKYEIENLKNLLIGKLVNIDYGTINERLFYEIEEILHTEKLIKTAMKVSTIEEMIYLYRATEYHDILHEIETRYRRTKEVFFIYAYLDRYFVDNLGSSLPVHKYMDPSNESFFVGLIIGTLVDFYNISTIMRAAFHEFTWEEVEILLTSSNSFYKVKMNDLKNLYEISRDNERCYEAFKKICLRYPSGQKYVDIIEKKILLHSLKKFYFNIRAYHSKLMKIKNLFDIGNILMFLMEKETEIQNLVTIFEGIKNDIPRKELENYLIYKV